MTGIVAMFEAKIDKVGSAATAAVQALRQAAMPFVPSGQHGQGFESSTIGMEAAHGISVALLVAEVVVAATTGADSKSCATARR